MSSKKRKFKETLVDGTLFVIERASDNTWKISVFRNKALVGDAIGFATKDYAYNYGLKLIGEFPALY